MTRLRLARMTILLGRRAAGGVLACLMAATLFTAMPAKPAEAQLFGGLLGGSIVHDPINSVFQRLSSMSGDLLVIKEFQLDAIAFQIAQGLVSQLIRTTIDWVNSGFQGSPGYITDLKEYLLGELDAIAGEFLEGSALGFLCEPFQFNVRLAIQTAYQESRDFERASQCTLSGAMENVRNFFGGDFAAGGWPQWFEVVLEPQNNVHGAFALGVLELSARLGEEEINVRQELNWGDGFLSVRDPETGRIVTPGALVAGRINSVLGLGEQSLVNADEINELISALMNQLATQALSGFRGLAGMSEGSGGQPPFTQQIGDPTYDTFPGMTGGADGGTGSAGGTGSTGGTGTGGTGFFTDLLAQEVRYADLHRPLVERLTLLEARARAAEESCPAVRGPLASVAALRTSLAAELARADANIATLRDVIARYESATSEAERTAALQEFEAQRGGGAYRTATAVAIRQLELESTVVPQIETLEDRIDDALDECGA